MSAGRMVSEDMRSHKGPRRWQMPAVGARTLAYTSAMALVVRQEVNAPSPQSFCGMGVPGIAGGNSVPSGQTRMAIGFPTWPRAACHYPNTRSNVKRNWAVAGRRRRTMPCWLGGVAGLLLAVGPASAKSRVATFSIFGYNATNLFPLSSLSLLTWALLLVAPGWRRTRHFALVGPALLAMVYVAGLIFQLAHSAISLDPMKLSGVMEMFSSPDFALLGWIHYCVFDPLIGLFEVLDAKRLKIPHWLVVPCLFLTLVAGPAGFLLYLLMRSVALMRQPKGLRQLILAAAAAAIG